MNQATGTTVTNPDPEAVLRLTCPTCDGKLNLRRKHLGMAGACVHCKTPVMAVERGEEVVLTLADPGESGNKPQEPARPAAQEVEEPAEMPPPLEPETPTGSTNWGFPEKEPNPDVLPPLDLPGAEEQHTPEHGFTDSESTVDSVEEDAALSLDDDMRVPLDFSGATQVEEEDTAYPNVGQENEPTLPEKSEAETKTLFGSDSSSIDNLFGDLEKPPTVQSGWGTGVPKQSHASVSPFATGSAESKPGFAETLFREKGNEPETDAPQSSASLNMPASGGQPAGEAAGTQGYGPYDSSKLGASELGELPPMTKEQEEEFAKGMRAMNQSRRSPFFKRLLRLVIAGLILGGAGYAAMIFLPEEQVNHFKGAVNEWLAPAKELMDSLPFGAGEGEEEGGGGFKIDAIEGLKTFSDEYDQYQKQAAEQLGTEVEEGPMEKRIPELPFGLGGKKAE